MIQTETEYHETKLHFIEEGKGVHNMQYSLLLVNNVERKLRNLQNQVWSKIDSSGLNSTVL